MPVRIDFAALLPDPVRAAVQAHTGHVRSAQTTDEGGTSVIAAILATETGFVFLKGDPDDDTGASARSLQREAAVNPYVRDFSPRVLWREKVGGWNLLAFEVANGRAADYAPGSPDLPKLAAALSSLAETLCPPVPLLSAGRRWAPYIHTEDQERLSGPYLLHTDLTPSNVLVTDEHACLIDWAQATRGAGFIELGCLIPRLIYAGHSPADAEDWAAKHAVWQEADPYAVTVFALATARAWAEFAETHPGQAWAPSVAQAAATWAIHRASPH